MALFILTEDRVAVPHRYVQPAPNNRISGALEAPSAYLMKSPPKQIPDGEARDAVERFIAQDARTKAKA